MTNDRMNGMTGECAIAGRQGERTRPRVLFPAPSPETVLARASGAAPSAVRGAGAEARSLARAPATAREGAGAPPERRSAKDTLADDE